MHQSRQEKKEIEIKAKFENFDLVQNFDLIENFAAGTIFLIKRSTTVLVAVG